MNRQRDSFWAALAVSMTVLLGALSGAAHAADDYPNRPIRLIVPFLAGGAVDAGARALAGEWKNELGVNIVVENRPGAGGNLGTEAVVRAKPDGYTLLVGPGATMAISPALYRNLPFHAPTDLVAIGAYGALPNVLLVSADSPVNTFDEFVSALRKKTDGGNFASGGIGSTSHLQSEILKRELGLKIVHVPFQSEPPALIGLARNDVDMMFSALSTAMPQIQSKKAKAIAIASPARVEALPGVPTLSELRVKGLEFGVWYGIFAPKDTPASVVSMLGQKLRATLAKAETRNRLAQVHVEVVDMKQEEFAKFVVDEAAKMKSVVDAVGAHQN